MCGSVVPYCAKPLFLAVEQAEWNAITYAWRGEYTALRIDEHDVDFGVLCGELQCALDAHQNERS